MSRTGRTAAAIVAIAMLMGSFLWIDGPRHEPGPIARIVLKAPGPSQPPPPPADLVKADPGLIKPLSPEEAMKQNDAIATFAGPIAPSRPFVLSAAGGALSLRAAADCLADAVYYESAGQPLRGQRAVAQVVLNRLRHPSYPKSVCGVVFQGSDRPTGCQFTFTCDGRLAHQPSPEGWSIARKVALAALEGAVEPSVGTATHYHAVYVVPYWASSLQKIAVIGAHIFYRFPGYWGKPEVFTGAYAGEAASPTAEPVLAGTTRLLEEVQSRDLAGDVPELKAPPPVLIVPQAGTLSVAGNPALRADEENGSLAADETFAPLPRTR